MNQTFFPESEQQVQELVRWADAGNKTISVQGNNTKHGFGLPAGADCVMAMNRVAGILEYHPEELVMAALPGTPMAEINQELARHNQHLAFEPPLLNRMYQTDAEGAIGGTFMGNLAGPRRFKAGSARDHILGVRAINGRAEVWKSGGKVIKNVSGYDMSKLLAGSWGTLSIVTEVIFKVLPAPAASVSIAVPGLSVEQAMTLLTDIISAPYETSGLAYLPEAALSALEQDDIALHDSSLTLIRLEGASLSVRERLRAIQTKLSSDYQNNVLDQAESMALWAAIRDVTPLHDSQRTPIILKTAIPPASATALARYIDEIQGCVWYLDAAGGWLWVGVCQAAGADKLHAIRREAAATGGATTLYRAPPAVQRQSGIYSFPDEAVKRLNTRIKHSFDPNNIFNPGRLFGQVFKHAH